MVTQTTWVERKFNFDFPVGVFPCIVERLRGTPARLEELVNALPSDILITRIGNSWSIQEHAGHLWDVETLWQQRLIDFSSGVDVLTPADMTNRKTNYANHNAGSIQNILREFRMARHDLVSTLEMWDEQDVNRSALHPRLNTRMRVVDCCLFAAEHDDHHVARIVGLSRHSHV